MRRIIKMQATQTQDIGFTKYQVFVIAILAILQFTIVLDFMVLSPLGEMLLDELKITTSQFGLVVSAYAFSAGASGLLAAGFADKYDRKKLFEHLRVTNKQDALQLIGITEKQLITDWQRSFK